MLSPEARAAVLAWARRTGALVIEDDYDAEYRYDRAPIGAMQGLDPDRVAYAGTASKTLAPGLRLGWLVLPPDLVEPFAEAKLLADRGSPILDQLTFADFLGRGEFDRHLRRMRPVYRSPPRRAAGRAGPAPARAGAGRYRRRPAPRCLAARRARRGRRHRRRRPTEGVAVAGVAPYRLAASTRGGLIFGYSNLSERTIADGVARLGRAVAGLRSEA